MSQIEITPALLAEWKAKTQALMDNLKKPDEQWHADLDCYTVLTAEDDYHVCTCEGPEEAASIACYSPPNVMAMFNLIDKQAAEIERLRAENQQLKGGAE